MPDAVCDEIVSTTVVCSIDLVIEHPTLADRSSWPLDSPPTIDANKSKQSKHIEKPTTLSTIYSLPSHHTYAIMRTYTQSLLPTHQ